MRRVSASWKNIGKQKNRSNPVLLHVKLFLLYMVLFTYCGTLSHKRVENFFADP